MSHAARGLLLVAIVALLAAIPVWIPAFPPMADLPQHAFQVMLLREMAQPGFPYRHLFEVNWFTPYLVGYLLVFGLSFVVGIVAACKIVVSLTIAGIPISAAALIAEADGEPRWALLAVPAMYGFDYQWGFLNFLVAVPLGLLFLALVVRVSKRPARRGLILVGLALNGLFFCHAMIAIACGAAAGLILLAQGSDWRTRVRLLLPIVSVIPLMAIWGLLTSEHPDAQQPIFWDLGWLRTTEDYYSWEASWAVDGFGWGRLAGILPRALGAQPSIALYIFGGALLLIPAFSGARLRRDIRCWAPVLVCAAILFLAPSSTFGAYYVAERFAVFVLPLYALLWTAPAPRRARWQAPWIWCALLLAAWISVVVSHTVAYQREAAGFTTVLSRLQPRERVMSFPFDRDSPDGIAPLFLHFSAWYGALDGGIVDPSLAVHHVELVRYRPDAEIGLRFWGFEFKPENFDWDYFGAAKFRYFLAREATSPAPHMFEDVPCVPRLVAHAGDWWAYENDCRE
ncbi:MAG: hypothetical protein ACRD1V_15415 [Vicinamibacterales bacterium]